MSSEKLLNNKRLVYFLAVILAVLVTSAFLLVHSVLSSQQVSNTIAAMVEEVRPIKLKNCRLRRFGAANDGGYLLCENLLDEVKAAYSYGISGRDKWGCDISRRYRLPVYQYDCFNLNEPVCSGGDFRFIPECVGPREEVIEKRIFHSMAYHIKANGNASDRLVVKMDIEGSEWDTLLHAPMETLKNIDQMAVEFHGYKEAQHLEVIRRLKEVFFLVHAHFNNFACTDPSHSFPAAAYELTFVNKRLGVPDPTAGPPRLPHPEDRRNSPTSADCVLYRD